MDNINAGRQLHYDDEQEPTDYPPCSILTGNAPSEITRSNDEVMTIDDITAPTSPNRTVSQAFTLRLPYARAVGAIREGFQSPGDTNKLRAALHAIEEMPFLAQPLLMRAFAENAPGLAKIGPENDLVEWHQRVAWLEVSLIEHFGPESWSPQLRDLYIANLYAQFLPCTERVPFSLASELERRMHHFPPGMWADFFQAAVTLGISLSLNDWVTFFTNDAVLSYSASDNFARSIGLKLLELREIADPVSCLARCGVSNALIERIVVPAIAAPLFLDVAYHDTTIEAECKRWGPYAKKLKVTVEASIFNEHIDAVRHNHASMLTLTINTDIAPQRVNDARIAFIKNFECDTIMALAHDQTQIDAFLTNWQFASTKVNTVSEWLKKFEHLKAESIPVVCRPALLDRWSLSLHSEINRDAEMRRHASRWHTWLETAALGAHPPLLGRLYVALIHVLDASTMIKSPETISVQNTLITQHFEQVQPSGWAWMLELSLSSRHVEQMDDSERQQRFTEFVLDESASASLPTPSFCFSVIGAASRVWERLPDRAIDERSKFDVFCDRFALPENGRAVVKNELLDGIVRRATAGKYTLSEGLSLGGFDTDILACRYAEKAFQFGIER